MESRQLSALEIETGINKMVKYKVMRRFNERGEAMFVMTDQFRSFGSMAIKHRDWSRTINEWADKRGYDGELASTARLMMAYIEWQNILAPLEVIDNNDLEVMAMTLDKMCQMDVKEGMAEDRKNAYMRGRTEV